MFGFWSRRKRPAGERGFTLTELLVTVGILAVVSSVAVPVYMSQQGRVDRAALEADLSSAFEQLQLAYREGRDPAAALSALNSPYDFQLFGSDVDSFCVQVTVPDGSGGFATFHRDASGFGDGVCQDPLVYPATPLRVGVGGWELRPEIGDGVVPDSWALEGDLPSGFTFTEAVGADGGVFVGPSAADWGWQAVQVAAGGGHICALTSAEQVRCWGSNSHGQLGTGYLDDTSTSADLVSYVTEVTDVAVGAQHTCVVATGGVHCWGRNNFGQVGNDTLEDALLPSSAGGLDGSAVAAGAQHTCAIAEDGIYCWGRGIEGQVDAGGSETPLRMSGFPVGWSASSAVAVYAGGNLSCVLDSFNDLYCWGEMNGVSAPGTGTPFASGVVSAAVGYNHICVLDSTDNVYCWGSNEERQLGTTGGDLTSMPSTPVAGLPAGVSQVTAGYDHSCALAAGDLYCWGSNAVGQTGDLSTVGLAWATPSAVPGLSSPAPAAAGDSFTCAVVSGGSVECWGDGASGQLGDTPDPNGGTVVAATPYCVDGGVPERNATSGEFECVTGQETVWVCPSGSEPDTNVSPPACLTVDPIPAEYSCPDGGTPNNTTGECTRPGTTWSYSAVTGYSTNSYAATATVSQSVYSYTCPSGGVLNGTTCYVTQTSSPTFSYYCSPDPAKANLRLVGTSCYWEVWGCPDGWEKVTDSVCASTNYPESRTGLCSSVDPKPANWYNWYYSFGTCWANITAFNATRQDRIAPADYGMNCGTGTLVGNTCQTTTTYPATYASVYSCPSGGELTSTSPPTCTIENVLDYYCDAAANGYNPSMVEKWDGTSPPSCRWYAWSCSESDGVSIAKPEPVSQWSCGSNYETSPSHCARNCTNSSSGSTAGQWCSNIKDTYCSGGTWSCSNNTSYSCPSGWTLSGTQCYRTVTSVSQYGYSGSSGSTCSALRGGCLSASWSCSWTAGTTSCVAAGSSGSLCSSIQPKPSNWCSWYSSGGRCYYSTNQTSAGYSTYNCPTSYSTSTEWTAATAANTASWSCTKYQTVNGPGIKVLRGGFAATPITESSTYAASGTPVNITTYSCPSGGTLSGSTCTYTTSYTYCPHGGTQSGGTCFVTDPPTTYPGTLVDGTGTPGFVENATETLRDVVEPASWTQGREYWLAPASVGGSGSVQGLPATVTVTMTDTTGATYQRTVVLALED